MAVLDLFPGAILGKSWVSDTSFFQRICLPSGVHPEIIPLLEEKMRGIIKKNPSLEYIEMVPRAAREYFLYHEQPIRAKQAEEEGGSILPLVRLDRFCDLYTTPPQQENFENVAFELFDYTPLKKEEGKEWIEIQGTGFFDKKELKNFVKLRKQWLKDKPWLKAEELGWIMWVNGNPILLPKGVEIYQKLEHFWRKQIHALEDTIEISGGNTHLYLPVYQKLKKNMAVWAFDREDICGPQDRWVGFSGVKQASFHCISCLQFIDQTFKMMDLNVEWVLCIKESLTLQTQQWRQEVKCLTDALESCEFKYSIDAGKSIQNHPAVELRIIDTIGERWAGPFLSVNLNVAHSVASIEYTLLGGAKRLIALLAELKQEKLPDCLS